MFRVLIKLFLFTFFFLSFINSSFSQKKIIIGRILDKQSDEPLPFASAKFKYSGKGVLTDSSGTFILETDKINPKDSLIISSVGYKALSISVNTFSDSTKFTCKLEILPPANEAVVKTKYNRALWFWKQIMKHKPYTDRTRWDNYSYEIYNKLEVDIENINASKLSKNALLKPLNFVFDYIDSTSEDKPFLPAYLTETLSDYYFQKDPHKAKELIKAARTNGIKNESLVKQLGGLYQNINVMNSTIPVFNREFISPFNSSAPNYYSYKLLDTQYLNKRRLVHLRITPKRKGDDVFEGDCWVNDTTFALQKITLRPAVDANINFLSGLSIIQEYKMINDSTWFLYKDKFVADISPIGKKNLSLKGRKTTTYRNVVVNSDAVANEVNKSKLPESVQLTNDYKKESDTFWASHRHEELSKNEKAVYKLLDTLENNKTYVHYRNTLSFLTKGTKDIGNLHFGPWFNWFSTNPWEGLRLRFDVATNFGFSKNIYLHGYGAYGFADNKYKGKAEIKYLLGREPWGYVTASYRNDLDNGLVYYGQLGTDNIFATLFRRPGIPFKFQQSEEKRLEYYQETAKSLGFGLAASSKQFTALQNLPSNKFFPTTSGVPFNSFEASAKIRYAYAERTFEDNFNRISLGSDRPIVQLQYTHAFKNVFQSNYTYDKIDFNMFDYVKIAPFGSIYYNFFAGKVYGTASYNFLQILPGNEMMYYNKYAFNLMNRFEFIADEYAGFNIEHRMGSGIFKFIPLTRILKLRQSWSAKGVVGTLSSQNRDINFVGNYPYNSLNGKAYLELGTGIDNIFKVFKVDFVWRLTPAASSSQAINKFGIFGSFRFTF